MEGEGERERETDPALITVSHHILPSSAKFSPFLCTRGSVTLVKLGMQCVLKCRLFTE